MKEMLPEKMKKTGKRTGMNNKNGKKNRDE